jgi:predicted MFS family arabinose efflux permease
MIGAVTRAQPHRFQVLSAGIASLVLTVGVARFAYTPLLPLMQREAGLGIAAAAWLATINYCGYFCGAVIAALVSDLVLKDRLYRIGLVLAVLTTWMMGTSTDPLIWAISRFLAGLSGAAGLLLGTGLILHWLFRQQHRSELGIHFSGLGLGMVVCAGAAMLMHRWQLDWHAQWLAFAALGAVLLVPALAWLPRPVRSTHQAAGTPLRDAPPRTAFLRLLMGAYFCAGVGNVISTTFIVAIIDDRPVIAGSGTLVFLMIGLGATPACMLWDLIARRTGTIPALLLAAILQIAGILLPLLGTGPLPAIGGALLFGATCLGIVSLVLTMAGHYFPTRPATMMGRMTLSYALAQVVGPGATGWLATRLGNYEAGLYLAAAVMAVGAVLFGLLLPQLRPPISSMWRSRSAGSS